MNEAGPEPTRPICPECGDAFMPWITMCPACSIALETGVEAKPLAEQVAPNLDAPESSWIDVPVSVDEPVKVALFTNFLTERGISFEESRRFVSIRTSDADELLGSIDAWAFVHDLPEDDRHHDSLASTLREIGNTVIAAVHGSTIGAGHSTNSASADTTGAKKSPIDLR